MGAPFAAIETATAINVVAALANAVATIGAAQVNGIFDADYLEAFDTMSGTAPSFLCASADVASIARGDSVIINGITYTVQQPPQPDGTGMTRLMLQKA